MLVLEQPLPAVLMGNLRKIQEDCPDEPVQINFYQQTPTIHLALAYHDILKANSKLDITVNMVNGLMSQLELVLLAGVPEDKRFVIPNAIFQFMPPTGKRQGPLESLRSLKASANISLEQMFTVLKEGYSYTEEDLIALIRDSRAISAVELKDSGLTLQE